MAHCEHAGCPNTATHSVTLNVPIDGVPINLHRPIKMYIGIIMCLEHARVFGKDFDWSDNEGLREAINESLTRTSASKADYDRTFHSVVKLTDPGYLQFIELLESRKTAD